METSFTALASFTPAAAAAAAAARTTAWSLSCPPRARASLGRDPRDLGRWWYGGNYDEGVSGGHVCFGHEGGKCVVL